VWKFRAARLNRCGCYYCFTGRLVRLERPHIDKRASAVSRATILPPAIRRDRERLLIDRSRAAASGASATGSRPAPLDLSCGRGEAPRSGQNGTRPSRKPHERTIQSVARHRLPVVSERTQRVSPRTHRGAACISGHIEPVGGDRIVDICDGAGGLAGRDVMIDPVAAVGRDWIGDNCAL
jgi:hypothetical protein